MVLWPATNQTAAEPPKRSHATRLWNFGETHGAVVLGLPPWAFAIAHAGVTNFKHPSISGYDFSATKTVLMSTCQAAEAMISGVVLTAVSYLVTSPNI